MHVRDIIYLEHCTRKAIHAPLQVYKSLEGGRGKCDDFWAALLTEVHSNFHIKWLHEYEEEGYYQRSLRLGSE